MIDPKVAAFVERVHNDIPLTQAMGWQLLSLDEFELIATAPLSPNINDKGTFFGGASAALMTISAWALIKFQLEQLGLTNDLVIHTSCNQWLYPQKSRISINCTFELRPDWQHIKNKLIEEEKNCHIKINCQASNETDVTAVMEANYVVLPVS